jgi:hypothetical protein
MSYCKSFLYTMLTTAGIRAFTYLAPVTSASISPVRPSQHFDFAVLSDWNESLGCYPRLLNSRKFCRYWIRASRLEYNSTRSICFMGGVLAILLCSASAKSASISEIHWRQASDCRVCRYVMKRYMVHEGI